MQPRWNNLFQNSFWPILLLVLSVRGIDNNVLGITPILLLIAIASSDPVPTSSPNFSGIW